MVQSSTVTGLLVIALIGGLQCWKSHQSFSCVLRTSFLLTGKKGTLVKPYEMVLSLSVVTISEERIPLEKRQQLDLVMLSVLEL